MAKKPTSMIHKRGRGLPEEEAALQRMVKADPKGTVLSKRWRVESLYKIRTKDRRLANLSLNPVQERLLSDAEAMSPVRTITLKSRQHGVSTFWLLFWLDDCLFGQNATVGLLAASRENLQHLFGIVRVAYEHLPSFLRPPVNEDTKHSLSFPLTRSRIFASLDIRAVGLTALHVSEAAFMEAETLETALGATGPKTGISVESTPCGYNHFRDRWLEAVGGDSAYKPSFFPWFLDPGNAIEGQAEPTAEEAALAGRVAKEYAIELSPGQLLFRRQKKRDLPRSFSQEYAEDPECCFLTSGNAFFDLRKVARLLSEAKARPPVEETQTLTVWEEPGDECAYFIGADVGMGRRDWSVAAVFCRTCGKQAARYRGRVPLDVFAKELDTLGRRYNGALLAPEANAIGAAVLLALRERRYPKLYIEPSHRLTGGEPRYGWTTDANTRPAMLEGLRLALEGDGESDEASFSPAFAARDTVLLDEALTFTNSGGRPEAAQGKHDDCIMAWAIAWAIGKAPARAARPFRAQDYYSPKGDAMKLIDSLGWKDERPW